MAIEFTCSGCSNTLRVPDEHAGKHARCPQCSSVNVIPGSSSHQPAAAPPNDLFGGMETSNPAKPENEFSQPIHSGYQPAYSQPHSNPYATPNAQGSRYYTPHRGGIILTFGILAIFCNFLLIPGIISWVMGASDLKQMKAGTMDPSGHGITMAGMVLGIVMTAMFALIVLFYLLIFIVSIVAVGAGV